MQQVAMDRLEDLRFSGFSQASIWVILMVGVLQCSCSSAPPANTQAASAKTSQPPIGLVVGDAPPILDLQQGPSESRQAGSETLKGAAKGAKWCMDFLRGGGGGVFGGDLAWVILCTPTAAVVGATIGGVSEAGQPAVHVTRDFRQQVARSTSTVQQDVLRALEHYAAVNGLSTVRLSSKLAAPPGNFVTKQSSPPEIPVGTLLEVNVIRIASVKRSAAILANGFAVEARIRVIALPGRKVVDSYSFVRLPDDASMGKEGQWAVGADLARAYKEIAETALDESVLEYRGKGEAGSRAMSASFAAPTVPSEAPAATFPAYTLRPTSPPVENDGRLPGLGSALENRLSANLEPVFQWEPLPLSMKELNGIQDVTYEFRLYQHGLQTPVMRSSLVLPSYATEMTLSPCKLYSWTVRAHFTLDGRPWVTEWAGLYDRRALYHDEARQPSRDLSDRSLNASQSAMVDPAWYRRNSFPDGVARLPNSVYYPQFRTPAASASDHCSEDPTTAPSAPTRQIPLS